MRQRFTMLLLVALGLATLAATIAPGVVGAVAAAPASAPATRADASVNFPTVDPS